MVSGPIGRAVHKRRVRRETMSEHDELLKTIEAVHAAGLDAELWPQCLASLTHLFGGGGATFEVIDKLAGRHREFYACGIPAFYERAYVEYWAARNPRAIHGARLKAGKLAWDYQFLDEKGMDCEPFYAELLPTRDFRYYLAATLANTADTFAVIAVQRTRRQGHVADREIAMMERLVPHLRQTFDVATRLKGGTDKSGALEDALDWLADGVALMRADGGVVYANRVFQAIARRNDGITVKRGVIEFAAAEAREHLDTAIGMVRRLRSGEPLVLGLADFSVPRQSGAPPYVASVRPLVDKRRGDREKYAAVAIIFIRDPAGRPASAVQIDARGVSFHRRGGSTRAGASSRHVAYRLCGNT